MKPPSSLARTFPFQEQRAVLRAFWDHVKSLSPRNRAILARDILWYIVRESVLIIVDPALRLEQLKRDLELSCPTCDYPQRLAAYQWRNRWSLGLYGRFVQEPPAPATLPCAVHGPLGRMDNVILRRKLKSRTSGGE